MKQIFPSVLSALILAMGTAAVAEEQPASSSKPVTQTLTPAAQAPAVADPTDDSGVFAGDYPGERATMRTLSTVLAEGADGQGLTMEEKWSNNVIVCKRTKVTGSRFSRKLCHTRAEWQAMRAHSREVMDRFKGLGAP